MSKGSKKVIKNNQIYLYEELECPQYQQKKIDNHDFNWMKIFKLKRKQKGENIVNYGSFNLNNFAC